MAGCFYFDPINAPPSSSIYCADCESVYSDDVVRLEARYSADPDCAVVGDAEDGGASGGTECNDGADNDGDGLADIAIGAPAGRLDDLGQGGINANGSVQA